MLQLFDWELSACRVSSNDLLEENVQDKVKVGGLRPGSDLQR